MIKHFCNICGIEHIEDDLVALLKEEKDSSFDILEDTVCPECCNNIKEFIEEQKRRHNIESKIDIAEVEETWTDAKDV